MAFNVNSFRVAFRVVDASGNPVPEVTVGPPSNAAPDVKAGETVTVTVPVTNAAGQPVATVSDAVPKFVSGANVLSSAEVVTPVAVAAGETKDVPVQFVTRADALVGQQAVYDVDLVVA